MEYSRCFFTSELFEPFVTSLQMRQCQLFSLDYYLLTIFVTQQELGIVLDLADVVLFGQLSDKSLTYQSETEFVNSSTSRFVVWAHL